MNEESHNHTKFNVIIDGTKEFNVTTKLEKGTRYVQLSCPWMVDVMKGCTES